MRSWIRLGLIVTAVWVVASCVTVIYLGTAPSWSEVRQTESDDWYRDKVETGTGRSITDWDRQMRSALDVCVAAQARKPEAERKSELCNFSLVYAEPTLFESMGITVRATSRLIAGWLNEFLFPIAIWSFFIPFGVWFLGIASVLVVLRRRGDRPRTAERPNRFIH